MKMKNLVSVAVVGLSVFSLVTPAFAADAKTKKLDGVAKSEVKKADSPDGGAVTEVKISPKMSGEKWKLTAWSEKGIDPGKFSITATFKGSGITGRSAVNRYFGQCTAKDDGSFSAGRIGMTEMAGPKDAMQAEQLYLKLLPKAIKYAIEGEKLRLYDKEGKELLVFEKQVTKP